MLKLNTQPCSNITEVNAAPLYLSLRSRVVMFMTPWEVPNCSMTTTLDGIILSAADNCQGVLNFYFTIYVFCVGSSHSSFLIYSLFRFENKVFGYSIVELVRLHLRKLFPKNTFPLDPGCFVGASPVLLTLVLCY